MYLRDYVTRDELAFIFQTDAKSDTEEPVESEGEEEIDEAELVDEEDVDADDAPSS